MASFQIGPTAYQSRPLDGETQLLVMKRLLPTFTALVGCRPLLDGVQASAPAAEADDDAAGPLSIQDLLMPVARELGALKDEDVRFILGACLDVTQRQVAVGTGWAAVRQRGVIQDKDDAAFVRRLTIAYHVLAENFGEILGSFGLDVTRLGGLGLPVG